MTQIWKGKALESYGSGSSQRRLIGVPFANGLRGNPVFNTQGKVVAMVDSGWYAGPNLLLPVATSIASLENLLTH